MIAISAVGVSGNNGQRNWNIAKTERIDYRQGAVDINFFNGDPTLENHMEAAVPTNMYFPTYIPDGFELNEERSDFDDGYYCFVDGDRYITYSESNVLGVHSIDTDRHVRENITVHGFEADLFYAAKEESTMILWREGPKVFDVSGHGISKEEVIKIAESVQRRK